MATEPIEYTVGEAKLRWTKLPALTLVREHGKIIQRADHGTLDMLAFQLTRSDQEAVLRREPEALFIMLKVLANVVGDADLAEECLRFLKLGRVQLCVETAKGGTMWIPLDSDDALANLPDEDDIYFVVWPVVRGLFSPLAKLLPASNDEAPEQTPGNDFSMTSETTSLVAPT